MPASFGNRRFWLDANQLTGYANTDPVDSWDDVYSNMDFTQSSASLKPQYQTGVKNGLPAIYFNFDYLQSANATDLNDVTGSFTFWCIYKLGITSPSLQAFFFKGDAATAGGTTFEFINWNGYNATYWQARTSVSNCVLNSISTEDTNWHYAIVTRNGSAWEYREDGASIETATLSGTLNTSSNKPTLGASSPGTIPMQGGYIGECGMVAEYIGSTEVSDFESELATKWDI